MELPGEAFLFNLSLIAITFTAVSTLVMLVRQTMGGKLSNFDVFLITTYVSLGFVAAWNAVLPGLIALLPFPEMVIWLIASLIAAFLIGATVVHIQWQRWKATTLPPPAMVVVAYSGHWIAVLLFLVNAAVPGRRGFAVPRSTRPPSPFRLAW
jgi:hypothetical protein